MGELAFILAAGHGRRPWGECVTAWVHQTLGHEHGAEDGQDEDGALQDECRTVDGDAAREYAHTGNGQDPGERGNECAEDEQELQEPSGVLRGECLDQHRDDGDAEHDHDRCEGAVVKIWGWEGLHHRSPAWKMDSVCSTAGFTTSSTGPGKKPSTMVRTAIGARARISRPLRSVKACTLGTGGPVMLRW